MAKIILVLTNHDQIGNTGKPTGWYLPEVAHPYEVFANAGMNVTFASPKGGATPIDPSSKIAFKDDPICQKFLNNADVMAQTQNSVPMKDLNAKDFQAIFYAGGHGPMFDMPQNDVSNKLAADVYENGGIASAVCHGPAGLVDVKLSTGEYLVNGAEVTAFTNDEEIEMKLMDPMPFALESRLREHGAITCSAKNWACNVKTSGRIVTGQNPASATGTGEAVVAAIKALKK